MSELNIKIRKLQDNGSTFRATPDTLYMGGVGSAKVDTLCFDVPEEWKGCAITLHVQRLSGTLPDPQLLDEKNRAVVDQRWTKEKQGLWMLMAVGADGYTAMTKPGRCTCYETIDRDSTTETITPSVYEQFVALVQKETAKANQAAKNAAASAEIAKNFESTITATGEQVQREITATADQTKQAIDEKAKAALASIPEDYTALSDSVGQVKEDIGTPKSIKSSWFNAPYTCYPMSEMVCMFSTPAFSKKYPLGTFVANTEYDAGTITTSGTAIVLRYQLSNNIAVDETNGLCAIVENNAGAGYNIRISDDNNGVFGTTLYNGILEKGANVIPLAGNKNACTYLYMVINGRSSISAAELNSIKFSLGKVPLVNSITPEPSESEQTVAFIGDSLTAQGYYNKMSSHNFVYDVYAIGGQAIGGILSRTNTIDLRIISPDTISNGAELTFANGAPINNQGTGNIGVLTLNGNNFGIEYTSDNKVIAKNVSSSFANNGETIKTSICDKDYTLYVYWCGTNNMQGGNVDYFIQSFEQILAAHPNSLILGITWDTSNMGLELVKAIDEAATKRFGNRFLPLHDNVVKYGLSYNKLTPTSEDTKAINNNLIPPSLRADQVHFNAYGQTYVAHLVQERMRTLGIK